MKCLHRSSYVVLQVILAPAIRPEPESVMEIARMRAKIMLDGLPRLQYGEVVVF